MDNPIILHCNCLEQDQTIGEMCRLAVEWGYDGVEFRRKRSGIRESPEEYLDAIAKARADTGLKNALFGGPGPNLMNGDASVRAHELDECCAFYRAAAERFELTVCNTMTGMLVRPDTPYLHFDKNGSNAATTAQWEAAVAGFRVLGDLAAELGFQLAFETHNCFIHDLPAPTMELAGRIDRDSVGVNFDFGNILLHPDGCDLEKALDTLTPRLYMVHLKNLFMIVGLRYENFIPCGLSDGIINNRALLRRLKALQYAGPIIIETPREGDRQWFAREDIRYLKTLIAELAGE